MQSLASLLSVKPNDVGNLDDFAESDEDEASGPGVPEARAARGLQPGGLKVKALRGGGGQAHPACPGLALALVLCPWPSHPLSRCLSSPTVG